MAEPSLAERPGAPAWLDAIEPKNRGLDLLGLRLPVQTIGNSLMDGITTITPMVRNFSLRTWLIWSYVNARRPDDWASFREYSANAEACIALGNHLAGTGAQGVVGIEEAAKMLSEFDAEIELKPLVAQLAAQIYANPSDEIGLTFSRDSGIPGITRERGGPIADWINLELTDSAVGSLLSDGETLTWANRADLEEFGRLAALNSISKEERDLLTAAIIPTHPRDSEVPRLGSFAILLAQSKELRRPPTEHDFFSDVSNSSSSLPRVLLNTRDGWLRYLVRDCLAVCHEATLAAVVLGIEQLQTDRSATVLRNQVLDWVIRESAREVKSLEKLGIEPPSGEITNWTFRDVVKSVEAATSSDTNSFSLIDRWDGQLQEWDLGNLAASLGSGAPLLLPVAWLLARRRAAKEIDEATAQSRIYSHQGWPRVGLEQVVLPQLTIFEENDWPFLKVVDALVQRTVDQHLRIAWSRLRSERPPRDVAVLTSDGERWCYRKSFRGGRTASRIPQAISWLRQLDLVDVDGITETGQTTLDRSLQALESQQ